MSDFSAFLQRLKDAGLIMDFSVKGDTEAQVQLLNPLHRINMNIVVAPETPQEASKPQRVPLRGTENPDPTAPAPGPIDPKTGQHTDYWVLSKEERSKGFVRPVRRTYLHVGPPHPENELRDLTEEELERYKDYGYVKYEKYPETGSGSVGRFWTQEKLDRLNFKCGCATTMGVALAETYARSPSFYSSTFCVACRDHLPVEEFIWDDGSGERVGS